MKLYLRRKQGAEIRDHKELHNNQKNITANNVKFKLYVEHKGDR